MNTAIIVAAGSGDRLGGKVPKQFIKINNKEILEFSVNKFSNHPDIHETIIVSHPNWKQHVINKYPRCKIICGGEKRYDSVKNGINAISKNCENVLIHDAARPFISNIIIDKCISALSKYDCSAPTLPNTNSIIKLDKNNIEYVDRSTIHIMQTPQCFKKHIIQSILKEKIYATDEVGQLIQKYPHSKIKLIKGDPKNIKITYYNDLKLFNKNF